MLVVLSTLSACVNFDKRASVLLELPNATATWHKASEFCQLFDYSTPLILETVNAQLPESCELLDSVNQGDNSVQLFCSDASCKALQAYNGQNLPTLAATTKQSYQALGEEQRRSKQFTQTYPLLHVASFGAIDTVIKQGLLSHEKTGLNPFVKPIIATVNSGLSTGVWPKAKPALAAFTSGQNYLTNRHSSSLRFSASFDALNCESKPTTEAVLGIAPEEANILNFVNFVGGAEVSDSSYIVKHWLDLSGQLHRKKLSVDALSSCSVVEDNDFDSAHASAYFLVLKNVAATTPIWYLPPRG